MNHSTHRFRRAAAATAVVAAGAALIVPATASAAPVSPTTPVPGTQCTVDQVERATAKVAPEFWKRISTNPTAKERFDQALTQTPEQRAAAREAAKKAHQAKIDEWRKANPGKTPPQHGAGKPGEKGDGTPRTKPSKQQVEEKIAQVKATCATS